MDLLSIETADWAKSLRLLDDPKTSWDDVQGLLVYAHLLAVAGRDAGGDFLLTDKVTPESSRTIATRWKRRFLEIEAQQLEAPGGVSEPRFLAHMTKRRRIVEKTFDNLIAVASAEDAPSAPAKRPRKVTKLTSKKPR